MGGGPSGLSAALGARRAGADVLLCEAYGCFGGVITQVCSFVLKQLAVKYLF